MHLGLKSKFSLSPSLAQEWQLQSYPPSPGHLLNFRIALSAPEAGLELLEQKLYLNSDPSSPKWTYQPHLTKQEVAALAAPPSTALALLQNFLGSLDIPISSKGFSTSMGESIVSLPAIPVHLAEKFLHTTYRVYKNVNTGKDIVRALEYSLPETLAPYVDWIQPTNYFGSTSALVAPARVSSGAAVLGAEDIAEEFTGDNISLAELKDLYNVGNYTPLATLNNRLGITG